jgi:hypothetical protein
MNPFQWRGQPSIFRTGKDAYFFSPKHDQNTKELSMKEKPQIISLPGASPNLSPGFIKNTQKRREN